MAISVKLSGTPTNPKTIGRRRRHIRVRKKVSGTAERPRLVVTRSTRHVFVQIVDDVTGRTLVSASTMEADLRASNDDKTAKSRAVGSNLAKRAKDAGIIAVVVLGAGTAAKVFEGSGNLEAIGVAAGIGFILFYVVMLLVYSATYNVKLKLAVWRMVAQSIDFTNPATLDTVSSVGAPSSPVGEGLADALSVGSY